MSDARSVTRFRLLAIMALMIALALGSFWVREVIHRSGTDTVPNSTRSEPDFYVEKFSFVKMSKAGKAEYHVSGDRLTHNPQDDSYDIRQPVVSKVGNNHQAPMIVRADRGRIDSDNSKVHMHDNVHLDRPASPTAEPMHVESEYMLLLPDEDVVQTDKPVEITFGQSKLKGIGMFANNATREFRLSSNVHGTYQVPAR